MFTAGEELSDGLSRARGECRAVCRTVVVEGAAWTEARRAEAGLGGWRQVTTASLLLAHPCFETLLASVPSLFSLEVTWNTQSSLFTATVCVNVFRPGPGLA